MVLPEFAIVGAGPIIEGGMVGHRRSWHWLVSAQA